MIPKWCCHCGLHKDPSQFGKDRTRPGGATSWCRACRNAKAREVSAAKRAKRNGALKPHPCPWCGRKMREIVAGDLRWLQCRRDGEKGKYQVCPVNVITRAYKDRTKLLLAWNKPFEKHEVKPPVLPRR